MDFWKHGDRVLVVAAHPDDETLGAGGTIARMTAAGIEVRVLFATDGVNARGADPAAAARRADMARSACAVLGVSDIRTGHFPDNEMDSVSQLTVTRLIEDHMDDFGPTILLTHHPHDLNVDHRAVSAAVGPAVRPPTTVRAVLFFEVLSSTEWVLHAPRFEPTAFVPIADVLETKISALRAYAEELRPFPHPRSEEGVRALAAYRGISCGHAAAEGFAVGRLVSDA